jgi:hypothetical protein
LGDIVDIRDRLLKKRVEEETAQAGGQDYVEGMQAEHEAELENVEEEVRGFCDSIMDDLIEFDIADESVEFSTDFIFMTEALRSLIMRARGFEHFVQGVADTLIEVEYDEETDMINGKWNIDGLLGNDPVIENLPPEAFVDTDELAKALIEDEDPES